MPTSRVSILIPSRNERFLPQTARDVLAHAHGDIEVIIAAEGYWPLDLPDDPRLKILHHGRAKGMRPSINEMASIASGTHLLKLDAHCLVSDGFDIELSRECDDDWIVIPRRYALEPEAWVIDHSSKKYPVDYHFLSWPWERPDDPTCGLHGTPWTDRRDARKEILLDDEMTSQGSCWFMSRAHWARLGDMEIANYGNFIHEFQELGMKTWLGGGSVKVNKRVYYAHLYKGRRYGRGYSLGPRGHLDGAQWVTNYWMFDRWSSRQRDVSWLIEKFWPVPGWPDDWQAQRDARRP